MSKKNKHEGHGGAWKVAYADFVTAMMALFMVLWISSQQKQIVLATAEYFQNPFQALDKKGGLFDVEKKTEKSGREDKKELQEGSASTVDLAFLQTMAQELYQKLNINPEDKSKPIDVIITGDGLKILMFNRADQPLFEKDSIQLSRWGDFALHNLSWLIERSNMRVRIDSYLDKDCTSLPRNDAWGVAVDRGNRVRDVLELYGLDPQRADRITGYVDKFKRDLTSTAGFTKEADRIELNLSVTNKSKKASKSL